MAKLWIFGLIILAVLVAPASAWWNTSFQTRTNYTIWLNSTGVTQDIFFDRTIAGLTVSNCTKEVRVTTSADVEIPSWSYGDVTNGTGKNCIVSMTINQTSATAEYWIYQNNPSADVPTYAGSPTIYGGGGLGTNQGSISYPGAVNMTWGIGDKTGAHSIGISPKIDGKKFYNADDYGAFNFGGQFVVDQLPCNVTVTNPIFTKLTCWGAGSMYYDIYLYRNRNIIDLILFGPATPSGTVYDAAYFSGGLGTATQGFSGSYAGWIGACTYDGTTSNTGTSYGGMATSGSPAYHWYHTFIEDYVWSGVSGNYYCNSFGGDGTGGVWRRNTWSSAPPASGYKIRYAIINDTTNTMTGADALVQSNKENATFWNPPRIGAIGTTEQLSTGSASVTIHTPQNKTYWQSSVPLIFSYNDTSQSTAACTQQLDSIYTALGNVTNSTAYSSTLALGVGSHALSIICQTSQGNKTASAAFTTQSHAFVSQESPSVVYETNMTPFTLIINQSNYIDSITANLTWNGTTYTAASTNTTTNYTFTKIIQPQIIQQNNSQMSWNWTYAITFGNGTQITNSTPLQTQNVTFSAWINSAASDRNLYIEGETAYISLNITDKIGASSLLALLFFSNRTANTTSYSTSSGYKIFTLGFYTSQITTNVTNETYNFWGNLSVSFGGARTWQQSGNQTLNVSKIYLTQCDTTYTQRTLQINVKTEENATAINASVDAQVTAKSQIGAISRTYAWQLRDNSTYFVCLYPTWATYKVDSIFQYWATSYSTRNYFLSNATLNNVSTAIDLFALGSSTSTPVIIYVKDENENPVQDVIVKARRFFVGQDAYLTVGMVKTDYEGKGITYLRINDVWYSFTLEKNGQTLKEIPPAPVICTASPCTLSFKTTPSQSEIWTIYGKISYSCSSNSTSKTIRCTVGDGTGLMSLASLKVEKQMPLSFEQVCNSNASSSSATLVCDFNDNSTGQYAYTLAAVAGGNNYHLQADTVNWGQEMVWGSSMGLMSTFLITATLAFVAINSPTASMVLSLFGLVISWALQLYVADWGLIMGLIISIGIIIYKERN